MFLSLLPVFDYSLAIQSHLHFVLVQMCDAFYTHVYTHRDGVKIK